MLKQNMYREEEIFQRSGLLLGEECMRRLAEVRVIVFGIGGVGSWCVESLVRTGLRHITIVDCDTVDVTNINRQLPATVDTVCSVKVDVMKRHLLQVNPYCEVEALNKRFSEENEAEFHLEEYDYIIDCIDSLRDKMALIRKATSLKCGFYSSMGAALKLDPTRIRIAEFRSVKGCPLARALRQRFKKSGSWPARKFKCVYSEELLSNREESGRREERERNEGERNETILLKEEDFTIKDEGSIRKQANGSLMHITSIFGCMLAGLVIEDIYGKSL